MGIASMVIGIVSAALGFIPFCNYFAFFPAVVGLILGIVDVVMKNKRNKESEGQKEPLGVGIAGIALNSGAIALIFIWTVLMAAGSAASGI